MQKNAKECREATSGRFLEAEKDAATGKISYPVVIISQGLGNLADKNYYTSDAVASGVKVYEGKKAYFDHPTQTQSEEQPGRSVKETAGHYENCQVVQDENGCAMLKANFVPEQNQELITKINHAIEYKKTYPDKDYMGISINGDGVGETMEYQEFLNKVKPNAYEMQKIKQIEGQSINVITQLTDAVSADLVTEAGARGRILLEQAKLKTRRTKMFEQFKSLFAGLEKGDKKAVEAAVTGMLQDEKKESDEKKEASKEDAMAKAMLQMKKEMKQGKDESEAKFEARCKAAAEKKVEADEKEKEKKESNEKKEAADAKEAAKAKKDDGDGDDDSKEKKESKSEEADGDDMMKKMKKEMDEMKAEIASMKKEKKEMAKESAELKATAKATEHGKLVARVLESTGIHPTIAQELTVVLSECKDEVEMKEKAEKMKSAYTKAMEEQFFGYASRGFLETAVVEGGAASNDHLF